MKKINLHQFVKYFFIITCSLYVLFSFCVGYTTKRVVYNERSTSDIYVIDNYFYEKLKDDSKPLGYKEHYRFSIDKTIDNDKNISFYLIHQTATVYIAGELVYASDVNEANPFGKSTSSYWATISLMAEDTGKLIDIYTTPLYEETQGRELEILYGSTFAVFLREIALNIIPLVFAVINIFVGIAIIFGQIILYYKGDVNHLDNIYLAITSIIMGIWKVSDNTIADIIFPNSAGLNYISQAIIIFGACPILLFVKSQFRHVKTKVLDFSIMTSLITSLMALILQLLNLKDLRETLIMGHSVIFIGMIAIIWTTITNLDYIRRSYHLKRRFLFSAIISSGVFIDMIIYYKTGSTDSVFLSLFALSTYSIYTFFVTTISDRHNAYTDLATGLSNKSKWDLLTKEELSSDVANAVVVLDLNGLKHINDTFGHDVGDTIIYHFAQIIRKNVDTKDTVCRWGGDEFVIVIQNAKQETIVKYLENIDRDVTRHNNKHKVPIMYAVGYAMSRKGMHADLKDLLRNADHNMYVDKKNSHLVSNEYFDNLKNQ